MHVLAVGSSVIDLFLTVDEKYIETNGGKVSFNLGDKVPSNIKSLGLGGNGANVSVGLTRLEIPTSFYTYLGNDALSREIEEGLTREGVELIAKRGNIKNAPLHIILDFNSDRVILSHYEKANHDFDYEGAGTFNYIFLNSIADEWEVAYEKVLNFSTLNNIPLAFSPGTRQLDSLDPLIYKILENSKLFFSNKEEAIKIATRGDSKAQIDIKDLLVQMKKLGPQIVSITDGNNGSYAIDADNNAFFVLPLPNDESSEKTGAGDGYATGFFAALLHNNDVQTAMKWGAVNANAVIGKVGAQSGLLKKPEIDMRIKENNNLEIQKI